MGRICICLLALLVSHQAVFGYVPEQELFPFGPSAGDATVPPYDDGYAGPISLRQPLPFFNTTYSNIFVNNNGAFSFISGITAFDPVCGSQSSSMIAPYWADINEDQGLGGATYYRETSDPSLLQKASRDVTAAFPTLRQASFSSLFIGTWYQAPFYGANQCGKTNQTAERNTFQGVLATNGVQSYAIFYYAQITWTTGLSSKSGGNCSGLDGNPAKVGFDVGNGKAFYEVPGSCSPDIVHVGEKSNFGSPGKWVFRIDSGYAPAQTCSGHGKCQCMAGFTGSDCTTDLDWCEAPLTEVDGHPSANSVCGNRGVCKKSSNGASCDCYPGFTGQFCDQLIPDQLTLSRRCVANNSAQNGCDTQQECIPDDLQCLLTPCDNPVGWCIPNHRATKYVDIFKSGKSVQNLQRPQVPQNMSGTCGNQGQCVCDYGYTGVECEAEIDWCSQPLQGFDHNNDLIKNVCGNGTCVNHPSGATCACNLGYTGPYCNEIDMDQAFFSTRCYAYAPTGSANSAIPVGCGSGQECVPENLQCLLVQCKNPIGWCIPGAQMDLAVLRKVLAN